MGDLRRRVAGPASDEALRGEEEERVVGHGGPELIEAHAFVVQGVEKSLAGRARDARQAVEQAGRREVRHRRLGHGASLAPEQASGPPRRMANA